MKNVNKKLLILFSVVFLVLPSVSCGWEIETVGSGKKGEVENIEWHEYDNLINQIQNMKASKERDILLHKAEEMFISTYTLIPVNSSCSKYISKKNISGFYIDSSQMVHIDNMHSSDGKKVINIQIGGEPETLDPALGTDILVASYTLGVFHALTKFSDEGKIVNDLLDHYELSEDGLLYTFVIKDNLKWSDGKALVADDFVYALKRNANSNLGAGLNYVLNVIEGFPNNLNVHTINDRTFTVKLNTICPYFLSIISTPITSPLRKDIVENDKKWAEKMPMITSGPYYIKEWQHKEKLVFAKNPYYYDAENIQFDEINFMLGGNAVSILNAYNIGDIDVAMGITDDLVSDEITTVKSTGINYLIFNTKNKFFEGMTCEEATKFRKAISYCIDRNFIYEISNKSRLPLYTVINDKFYDSENELFCRNSDKYIYPYNNERYFEDINLDKARDILREIGYHFDKNGKLIENVAFEMLAFTGTYDYMSVIQADLEKIGIHVKLKRLYNSYLHIGDYFMAYAGWIPDYFDPLALLEIFTSNNPNNYCFINRDLPN